MKIVFSYLLSLIFIPMSLPAQVLTGEQVREDFEFFNGALDEGHPGLYWFISKKKLDETTSRVETALHEVTDVKELQSLFVDVINTISCGHTAVMLPDEHYRQVDSINLFLPFNIALVEGKVLVAESFSGDLLRGDQILRINNEPIDEIIEHLQRFIPVDKEIQSKRARSIEIVFPFYYALYKGSYKIFSIEYIKGRDGNNLLKEVDAVGKSQAMFKSVRDFAPAQMPIEFSIDESGQTTILKLATFSGQSFKKHGIDFQDTIKSIFEYLAESKVDNLVIDLRWNNGGNMRFAEYLFSFFIDTTYRYYSDAEIKQAVMEGTMKYARSRNMKPMLEKQFGSLTPHDGVYFLSGDKVMVQPAGPRFTGALYLLTNGFSFSATSSFLAHIQQNKLGVVIGETPGGAFSGVNAGPPVVVELPNSKIRLFYRIIGTRYSVDQTKISVGVDYKVDNTYEGFYLGDDVQLGYVLELIKE